jgi:DNA replication protein DnaC
MTSELDTMLRRLHMPTVRRLWSDLQIRAEKEGMRYSEYLETLVAEEIAHRSQTRVSRMTHRARFPFLRTIEEFDFTFQSSLRKELLGSYLGPEFVAEGRNLLIHGPSGVGKTHVAIAVAYKAIQNGSDARFVTGAHLIDELSAAGREGRLREALVDYTHAGVLVVDEVGYLSYGPDAANVLFQVVNDRYLNRRPMVFTTNKPVEDWGRVLHDPDLAEAILDRVLERGRVLQFKGPSYRTRHLRSTNVPIISGKGTAELREPTPTYALALGAMRAAIARFNATLEDGTPNPERPVDLPNLERELEQALSAWDVTVELEVPTPELDALVSRPAVHIDDGHKSSLQRKGHGLQRSFLLAALSVWRNHLAENRGDESSDAAASPVILAIEEPELYLHPQQQRVLFDLLKAIAAAGSTQIILSSHSPIFIDVADTTSILRTGKTIEGGTKIKQLSEALFSGNGNQAKKDRFHLTQWINPTRGELFFAKKVVLVEGPTEIAVIPYVANRLGIFNQNVAVIECGGKGAVTLYIELLKSFEIDYAVVHDEDPVVAAPGTDGFAHQSQMFGLNRTISTAVGDPGRIQCISPEFEILVGVSETQGRRKGKPLAALEALEGQPVLPALESLVRWVYS